MSVIKLTGALVACVVLSACASRQDIAARQAAEQASMENRCASFGYRRGSLDYSKCLESVYLQRQQAEAIDEANRQALLQAGAQSLQQAGAALQSVSAPPPIAPPVHCTTMPTAPGMTTTCF